MELFGWWTWDQKGPRNSSEYTSVLADSFCGSKNKKLESWNIHPGQHPVIPPEFLKVFDEYLGGGNSKKKGIFHPELCENFHPIWQTRIFFKWVAKNHQPGMFFLNKDPFIDTPNLSVGWTVGLGCQDREYPAFQPGSEFSIGKYGGKGPFGWRGPPAVAV